MGLARRILPGAGVQHPQRVRDCRDAPDRRTRGGRAALLLQGHSGGQSVDRIDVWHAHLVKQSAGVRRDGLEVPALRLRIERAERQRRFAGAGHSREHDQGVTRDIEIDVLEIVLPGAARPERTPPHFCSRRCQQKGWRVFAWVLGCPAIMVAAVPRQAILISWGACYRSAGAVPGPGPGWPVRSQTRAVLSQLPEASVRPSGEKVRTATSPWCPTKRWRSAPVARSMMRTS